MTYLERPLTLAEVREQQRSDGTVTGVVCIPLSHLVDCAPTESGIGFIDVLVSHFIEGNEGNSPSEEDTQMLGNIDYRVVGHQGKETLQIEITADVRPLLDAMNGAPTKARFRLEREITEKLERLALYYPELSAQCQLALATSAYAEAYTHPTIATTDERQELLAIIDTFERRMSWISSINDRLKTFFRHNDTERITALATAGITLPITGLFNKTSEELSRIFYSINDVLCPRTNSSPTNENEAPF